MANVSFIRGTLEKVNSQPKIDGQLLVATDKGCLFVDTGVDTRVQITSIIKVDSLPEEAATANGEVLYYDTTNNILAYSNGESWVQVNAQLKIKEGATDGTISVGGIDVPVHGLKSAAYQDSSAFDPAGSAAAVLGSDGDGSSANTVYGAKKGVEEAKSAAQTAQEAAQAAQSAADSKVATVTAGDNSITVAGSGTAPTVAVKLSAEEDNALKLVADGLKVEIGAAPEYTIEKEAVAETGFLASYVLKKDGVQAGQKINIPKDYLVKSAEIKESIGEGDPSTFPAGTKYIDFVINTIDTDGTESHIYLNVAELVDAYTAGNGIEISPENQVSAKVVAANGLSVDSNGIAMAVASGDSAGAMSAAHYTKLEGIEAGAQVNKIESITFNGSPVEIQEKAANITFAWTVLI